MQPSDRAGRRANTGRTGWAYRPRGEGDCDVGDLYRVMTRRVGVVLATAVFALAMSLSSSGATPASSTPIPWLDAPLPLYHLPSPKVIPYPTNAPPCEAGVVRVRHGRGGAATGHLLDELLFTNTSTKPCLLRGYPRVEATSPTGAQVVLHPSHGTFFGPLIPATLAPHGHSLLDFETDDACDNGLEQPTHYRHLRFTLPSGGSVSGGSISLTVVCGLAISSFGLKPRYTDIYAARGTPGALQVRINLPKSASPGGTLTYTVTLSNPTRQMIRFPSTCPGYTQGFYTTGAQVHGSYRLNCSTVRSIPPHASATFAMELQVPQSASTGLAKFGWNLDTPTGPFAGNVITVER